MKKTDEQLISKYLEGNENALETLVDRYLSDTYNFAFQLTHDSSAAEDVAQESFIKAWKNIRGWKRGSSFKTWLFAITRNTAIDWLRKRKDVPLSIFDNEAGKNLLTETLADENPSALELIEKAENTFFVANLLEALDPLYRDVINLRYGDNLTFKEIGEILKRPLHTIKSQHRRAIIAIRRSVEARTI
ncbi:MAG: RNA polymerase sigma factor [Candidatus Paceibacterota bacterium]